MPSASVLVNGQQIDVETTNPFGFNPGARKDFTDSFGKVTGFAYVPPGNYSDRRSIGEKELLSLILYNRVSEYVRRAVLPGRAAAGRERLRADGKRRDAPGDDDCVHQLHHLAFGIAPGVPAGRCSSPTR